MQAPRAALRERHLALHLELAELLADDDAIDVLRAALVADPLHEGVHRALMLTYAASGRRQQALAQYEELRRRLRRELEADPDQIRALCTASCWPAGSPDVSAPAIVGLPRLLTSFVGRERELGDIARALDGDGAVDAGRAGRSGRRASRSPLPSAPPAETCFVFDLGVVADPGLVDQAVATALGMRTPARRAIDAAIVAHIGERELLLILDTCEHVVGPCAALAEALQRGCSGVRVLATSREPLRCAGERTWRVPGLAVPDPSSTSITAESVRLFAERAAASGFVLDAAAAHDVATICFRLDGMPLAIELAAARVDVLSVAQIAARLGDCLDVLGEGRRTALTRQQTLRAAIAWSEDLLDETERLLFRRLGVFAGSFDSEAAEQAARLTPYPVERFWAARPACRQVARCRRLGPLSAARHDPPVRRRALGGRRRARGCRGRAPPVGAGAPPTVTTPTPRGAARALAPAARA